VDNHDYADMLRRTMADLTQAAAQPNDIGATLRGVTAACAELITGADCADILVIAGPNEYDSLAPTSDLPPSLDDAQLQFGKGPCISAATGETVVRCDDLREDARWPRFAKAAVAVGIHSVLSFQLLTHDDRVSALNIFGLEPNCFAPDDETVRAMFATHAALALIADDKQGQFESALASRDLIGQAKGRIMERFDVDAVRAFELLRTLSQTSNTRLAEVAGQVVSRGADPPDQR
jgi:hypothetical protein